MSKPTKNEIKFLYRSLFPEGFTVLLLGRSQVICAGHFRVAVSTLCSFLKPPADHRRGPKLWDTLNRKVGDEGSKSAWLQPQAQMNCLDSALHEKYSFSTIKPLLYRCILDVAFYMSF